MIAHPDAEAILGEFGIEIIPANVVPQAGQTRAVVTVSRIIKRYGVEHARMVIMTLTETANNKARLSETAIWATSDVILAFRKNYPHIMAGEISQFFAFYDRIPVGHLQHWVDGLDGITNKRAALVGLLWERAVRVFGDPQLDLLDDRRRTA